MRARAARWIWVAVLCHALAAAAPVAADVIHLKNGNKIRGMVISNGAGLLVLEMPYGRMTIPSRLVASIESEAEEEYLRKAGEHLMAFEDVDHGLELLRRAFEADPDAPSGRRALLDALHAAADQRVTRGLLRQAEALLAEASALAPSDASTGERRAELGERLAALSEREDAACDSFAGGDYTRAYAQLSELLRDYPEERERFRKEFASSAVYMGHEALRGGDPETARRYYHEAIAQEPDLVTTVSVPLAFCEARCATPLLEQGKFREARLRLQPVLDLLPGDAALIYLLGLACEGDGDLGEAARLYGILAGPEHKTINGPKHLAELRLRAEERLGAANNLVPLEDPRWRAKDGAWRERETRHFVIHHQDPEQAEEAERYLEHHLRRLERTWFAGRQTPRFAQKIEVHLHGSVEALRERSAAPHWSNGYTALERRYGLITSTRIHLNIGARQLLSSVIPHELAHALIPHRMGSAEPLPLWLDEGIATSEEAAVKQEYYERVVREAAAAGALLPLAELLGLTAYPATEAEVGLLYAQSNSLVRFLRTRWGSRKFFDNARRILLGADEALRQGTEFDSLTGLESAWLAWVRTQ